MVEIERKFLVLSEDFKSKAESNDRIVQGFLNTDPERTVRVRIYGEEGSLVVKGANNESGTTRLEIDTPISKEEALALLEICEPGIIDKTRYRVPVGKHVFEVDVFHSDNQGLVVAEVELSFENEQFEKPEWLGMEVTGDKKYYNSLLSKHPYKNWMPLK